MQKHFKVLKWLCFICYCLFLFKSDVVFHKKYLLWNFANKMNIFVLLLAEIII